jgi:WD40 repeat protein
LASRLAGLLLERKLLAIGDRFGDITLWDVPRGKEIATLRAHRHRVFSLAYSADAATLASVGDDNAIRLWDLKTTKLRLFISARSRVEAFFVAITRDGKRIAAVSLTGVVKLWDAMDGRELATLQQEEHACPIIFSPDGRLLVVGCRRKVKVWKLPSGSR